VLLEQAVYPGYISNTNSNLSQWSELMVFVCGPCIAQLTKIVFRLEYEKKEKNPFYGFLCACAASSVEFLFAWGEGIH
jgi:hypothetical protein